MEILFGVMFWVMCAIGAAAIGGRRNRAGTGFVLGLLFGPFGMLFSLLIQGNRSLCPHCKELVHEQATICPHCRREMQRQAARAAPLC